MPLHFSSPHCRDVIEIRTSRDTPAVGCIRVEGDSYHLFEVRCAGLELAKRFGALGDAKAWAEKVWNNR